jgi:hypothetical protein
MADTTPREKTTYVVLRCSRAAAKIGDSQTATAETWEVVARDVAAASAEAAIKAHSEKQPDSAAGIYVAVPARSWKPSSVKVETQTIMKVG